MTLIEKVRWSLLAALTIAAVVACGEPAGRRAAYRQAAAVDPSPPKAGDPVGALPSLVVSGEVAAFEATATRTGAPKSPDTAGSLPSSSAAGVSAVYAPAGRAEAIGTRGAAAEGAEAAAPPRPTLPE